MDKSRIFIILVGRHGTEEDKWHVDGVLEEVATAALGIGGKRMGMERESGEEEEKTGSVGCVTQIDFTSDASGGLHNQFSSYNIVAPHYITIATCDNQ